MAVTSSNLITGSSASVTSSYATASITPSANQLVLAFAGSNVSSGAPNTPTCSGNGLTWVQVATLTFDTVAQVTMFRAMGSPSAGAVTFDFAAQNQSRCVWTVNQSDGVDTSGTNGSGAVVQSASNSESGGTSLTVTLAAFGNTANATMGAMIKQGTEAITEGAGFTQLSEDTGNNIYVVESEFKNTNDTTVDWSWATASTRSGAIAVEIKAAPSVQEPLLSSTAPIQQLKFYKTEVIEL